MNRKYRRLNLFEFEDQAWFPDAIRNGMTNFLRYFLPILNLYQPITPLLLEVLYHTKQNKIIDLCSGAGGAIEQVQQNMSGQSTRQVSITLTDKYPNPDAWKFLQQKTNHRIGFCAEPIDVLRLPMYFDGVLTLFSAAHHFNPKQLKEILKSSVGGNNGICFFDGGGKNIFLLLAVMLFQPLFFLLFTPFFRPFKISSLVFTYLIPIIPFCTVWDGCVSIMRLYQPKDFLEIAVSISAENYIWKAGRVKNKLGLPVAYLIGYPKSA